MPVMGEKNLRLGMEKRTNRLLNELLVNLFNNILDTEAKAVITEEFPSPIITSPETNILTC